MRFFGYIVHAVLLLRLILCIVRPEKGESTLILHLSLVQTGLMKEQAKLHLRRLFSYIIKDIHCWASNSARYFNKST